MRLFPHENVHEKRKRVKNRKHVKPGPKYQKKRKILLEFTVSRIKGFFEIFELLCLFMPRLVKSFPQTSHISFLNVAYSTDESDEVCGMLG